MLLNMALVWLMILFSKWYIIYLFEMIFWNYFLSLKKGLCWPSFRDYLLFDIRSAQSAERFFMIPVSKWYMTFISKWAMRSYFHFEMLYDCHFEMRGQNFRTQNYFRQEMKSYFIDENASIITIFVHSFLRKAWSLSLRWNKFFKKGDGLLCQILIILQC